ncbi:MAG: triphosphoribosyl-dephospho-CoA synthase MdcB [Burkholderiales bacterium]|nr:triphosphoribosyl-dephospho-CoA synthase MdcB [Burkholderiales bacterium]
MNAPATRHDAGPGAQPAHGQRIGRAAVAALYDELALAPKPGLVSFVDSGSHDDMDARTFLRSLFALRHGFVRLAGLGARGAGFEALAAEGVAAEQRMLQATGGINTHRGAIFSLGLLCAAAGAVAAAGGPLRPDTVRRALLHHWGAALAARPRGGGASHGAQVRTRLGLPGAAEAAAAGFPVLFETTWPTLAAARQQGLAPAAARLQALMHTVAVLPDTNLAHRGGTAGLRHAQASAQGWLRAGGAFAPDGLARARTLHRDFVARRLSPGGAADMLAAACWLQRVGGFAIGASP